MRSILNHFTTPAFKLPSCLPQILILFLSASASAAPLYGASIRTTTAVTCRYDNPCNFGPTKQGLVGGGTLTTQITNSYVYVPPSGSSGGFSVGASAQSSANSPDAFKLYASVGGYALIPAPFALSPFNVTATSAVGFADVFQLPYSATLRYSWLVDGSAFVSYSAPGTPSQAIVDSILGINCSVFFGSFAPRPCRSSSFPEPPPGSFELGISRRLSSTQKFSETFTIDVPIFANSRTTVSYNFTVSSGMGYISGTPAGEINGTATADFLNTAKLISFTVLDSSGNIVNNPQLSSDSGFDYFNLAANQPPGGEVPEPSSSALLAVGSSFILIARHIKKSR